MHQMSRADPNPNTNQVMSPNQDYEEEFEDECQIQTPYPTVWNRKVDEGLKWVQHFGDFSHVQKSQHKHFAVSSGQNCG